MSINKEPNFARGNRFELTIPEAPIVAALAQDFLIPALTVNPAEVPNQFVDYALPGEKIVYGEIDVGFIVDDNFDAYVEIHNWMRKMCGAYQQQAEERLMLHCDVTMILLNNNHNPVRRMIFHDCWPTSLGAASYDLLASDPVKSILTMKYSGLSIDPDTIDISGFNKKDYITD